MHAHTNKIHTKQRTHTRTHTHTNTKTQKQKHKGRTKKLGMRPEQRLREERTRGGGGTQALQSLFIIISYNYIMTANYSF